MNHETMLFNAVAKALNIKIDISAHAVIRYVERFLKHDVKLSFMIKTRNRNSSGTRVTDDTIITYIKRNHPDQYDLAMDHLTFLTRGRTSSFTDDGIRYTIRDLNLITIFEEKNGRRN
jgi:hypothetical protein